MVAKIIEKILLVVLRLASAVLPSPKILKLLLAADNMLDRLINQAAIMYDKGIHPKHRLTAYHDYFVKNINGGENILDIGCGNGAVTYDIAKKTKGLVIGMDKCQANIDYAQKHYRHDRLKFLQGDVLLGLPENNLKIDTVVMSNLIEHIEMRVEFLKGVLAKIKPKQILFRIPMYEREWMVPFKEELGVEHRCDQTHYTEYIQEDFFAELKAAGLRVESYEIRWGEIWAKTLPINA